MAHPTARGIASAAAVFIALIFFLWGFQRLLALGGTPEQRGMTTHYRLEPMIRIFFWTIMLAGVAAIWSGTTDLRSNRVGSGITLIIIGVIAAIGGGIGILGQYEIILDPTGIRYHSIFGSDKVIAWEDLSHFEQFYNSRGMTTNYFLRSRSGITITAGDSSFDTEDLLHRINEHHPITEKPYQRKVWYGG